MAFQSFVQCFVVLVLTLVKCSAVFQPHWTKHMLWVIQQHEICSWAPLIVTPPLPPLSTLQGIDEHDKYVLPDVINIQI